MKRWLTEGFGVAEDTARRIWKARQVLHGAHAFDSQIWTTYQNWRSPFEKLLWWT
jgi:hypothetical protein